MAILFNKSLSLLSLVTMFLMLLNNAYSNTSFNYIGFSVGKEKLIFQGDAAVTGCCSLELTRVNEVSVGRVLHSDLVQLWVPNTNRASNFETTFTFRLSAPPSERNPADGFAFFIAPPDSTIPEGGNGGLLGLFPPSTALDPTKNKLVAVEFDTFFYNNWDPNFRHIGIDVNSINSSAIVRWDRQEGVIGTVRITYDAVTRNLIVASSYYPGGTIYQVSHIVDLRAILPQRVRVGLSASSGANSQAHTFYSWNFVSTLRVTEMTNNTTTEDMYISSIA